jgi:hypothetical protein
VLLIVIRACAKLGGPYCYALLGPNFEAGSVKNFSLSANAHQYQSFRSSRTRDPEI